MTTIHRRAVGVATMLLASAGALLVAPTTASAAPARPSTVQSCTVSHFTVVWPVAGVYVYDGNGNLYHPAGYDKYSGDHVNGPTGGSNGYWTTVYLGGGGTGYMRDPALRFDSCN